MYLPISNFIDSVFRIDKASYREVYLEECKYIVKEKMMSNYITDDIIIFLMILIEKILIILMIKILINKYKKIFLLKSRANLFILHLSLKVCYVNKISSHPAL